MSKLKRILFLQGKRCFFCDRQVPAGEESLEHLMPVSHGGDDDNGNLVVCCKTLNHLFGGISIKEKMRAVLKHEGKFTCPCVGAATAKPAARDAVPPKPAAPNGTPPKPAAPKVTPPKPAAPRRPLGMVLNPDQSLGLKWPDTLAP